MITKKDIENLGWKKVAVCANGGTLMFSNGGNHLLHFNGENSIYKSTNDYRLKEIEIKYLYSDLNTETVYKGHPLDVDDLRSIISSLEK